MKSATLPPVRVDDELRQAAEGVLREGETLSGFIAETVRSAVHYRRAEAEFRERGEAAWQAYQRSGVAVPAETVLDKLQARLDAKRREFGA